MLDATATDGWILTRHGEVLEERYPSGVLPDTLLRIGAQLALADQRARHGGDEVLLTNSSRC